MEYRKFADTYVIRLDKGEEIISSLQAICEKENIRLGSVEGIGAADHAVIGLYDVANRQYHKKELNGPMEISSCWALLQEKTAQCICICTSTCAIRKCRSWAVI